MASSQVQKAQRRVYWSFAFLLALVALLVFADDRSAKAVSATFAAILGIPFLLLSLFDLGRALKSDEKGGSGTRTAIWLLSHLQGAFGAVCMAAATFTVYHNIEAWLVAPARDRVLLTVFIFSGFLMVLVGFMFIHSAFVSTRKSDAG